MTQSRALVLVHGGAGPMRSVSGARAEAYRVGLESAARAGRAVLLAGGDALDAVQVAAKAMEGAGVFNAGLGSCLDETGAYALDAALMRGSDRAAGAVGACTATCHPLELCRDLLDEGRHVMLVGEGADARARRLDLPPLPPPPADKLETLARLRAKQGASLEDLATVGDPDDAAADACDTVGAVALDAAGRLAASVTTGGLWLKAQGRVGDSAIVGAGLFACDELGAAASATGIGERMMRALTSLRACDAAAIHGAPAAAAEVIAELESRFGADSGGIIVVDRMGRVGARFNTRGMGRALARVGEEAVSVAVWPEDPFPER